jgi:hypothetical protein
LQYGQTRGSVRGFSWKSGITEFRLRRTASSPLGYISPRLCLSTPTGNTYRLKHRSIHGAQLSYSVPAHFNATLSGAGILTRFPSSTPRGLDLGTGSPLGGLSYPRKPWTYGDRVSHSVYRYSCLHKLFSGPSLVLPIQLVSP